MSRMDRFRTRQKASSGIKIDLLTPTGEASGEWLMVRSELSDEFRAAKAEALKLAVQTAQLRAVDSNAPSVSTVVGNELIKCRAALVAGWSFDEECTPENVQAFLLDAPQIADQVDRVAADALRFFGSAPSSSTDTQSGKSA